MKLLKIIPIAKGFFPENLSYFTTEDIKAGALVAVPVKNKIVPALVASAKDVKEAKSEIRKSPFSLKKIKSLRAPYFIKPEMIKTAESLAFYYISPVGAVLKSLISQKVLETPFGFFSRDNKKNNSSFHKIFLLEGSRDERLRYYRTLIREEFAKNLSVFLCLPTTVEIENISGDLKRGIEKYTIALHGNNAKKNILKGLEAVLKEKHPVLIISTPLFLSIPRDDIGTIIIDGESSPHYKLKNRPYIDFRKAAEELSINSKTRLILGDEITRVETHYQKISGKINSILARLPRIPSEASQTIVDMRASKSVFISDDMSELIRKAREANERVILFINRRGYNTTTICKDCGSIISCNKCDTPLILHQSVSHPDQRNFLCHKCLSLTPIADRCPHCKSWKMQSFGVGIQKIGEELNKIFPGINLFRLDSDIIKTKKQGDVAIKNWLKVPESVLLTTEIIFSYLYQPVEHIGVVSVDNLLTIPDFRINERVFRLLLKLRKLSLKTFIIQSRLPNQELFENLIKGNVSEFYRSELEMRKQFNYPPFKTFIKITIESKNQSRLQQDIRGLMSQLKEYNPIGFPAFISKIKNIYSWHILLKLEPQTWPAKQENLCKILSSLPPIWKIDVDPETLL